MAIGATLAAAYDVDSSGNRDAVPTIQLELQTAHSNGRAAAVLRQADTITAEELSTKEASEQDECDPIKGHSCTPHLLSSVQSGIPTDIRLTDSLAMSATNSPDDGEWGSLFRPPIVSS